MNNIGIFIKLLVIFVVLCLFYKLNNQYQNQDENQAEGFETINYIKLNETYITPDTKKIDLLYTNYDGDDLGKDIWDNKTLDQCTDVCNQLDNCVGFSRDLINDDATGQCYPLTHIANCHSNRKGDTNQMHNAIKFNSYIKTNNTIENNSNNINTILTKCIGDTNLTLNKTIFIKSHLYPTKYIGALGDSVLVLIDDKDPEFNKKCNFRIESGKDGGGTISFFHIDTNMYIYRNTTNTNTTNDTNATLEKTNKKTKNNTNNNKNKQNKYDTFQKDTLILKDITLNKTNDKQRVSFNIIDSMKTLMKFKCLQLDGETIDKFIVINPDNKNYLACMEYNDKLNEYPYTFSIMNNIVKSAVFTNKEQIPNTQLQQTTTTTATTNNTTKNNNTTGDTTKTSRKNNTTKEPFFQSEFLNTMNNMNNANNTNNMNNMNNMNNTNNTNNIKLDTTDNILLYQNLFTKPTNLHNFITDNYNNDNNNNNNNNDNNSNNDNGNNIFYDVSKKMNDIVINNQLSTSINKKKDEYDAINKLNIEIEKEISNRNIGLNAKNDKIYNNINKMHITDMASDYYKLKNITRLPYITE